MFVLEDSIQNQGSTCSTSFWPAPRIRKQTLCNWLERLSEMLTKKKLPEGLLMAYTKQPVNWSTLKPINMLASTSETNITTDTCTQKAWPCLEATRRQIKKQTDSKKDNSSAALKNILDRRGSVLAFKDLQLLVIRSNIHSYTIISLSNRGRYKAKQLLCISICHNVFFNCQPWSYALQSMR